MGKQNKNMEGETTLQQDDNSKSQDTSAEAAVVNVIKSISLDGIGVDIGPGTSDNIISVNDMCCQKWSPCV